MAQTLNIEPGGLLSYNTPKIKLESLNAELKYKLWNITQFVLMSRKPLTMIVARFYWFGK